MILEGAILDTFLRWAVLAVSMCLFYILFSLGLTLIFGFHEVLNFAHGGFYMLGAYIGLLFFTLTGNFGVAIIASVLCTMLIAALFERGLVSKLYGTDPANNFLLTFAFGLTFIGIVKLIAGVQFKYFARPELLAGAVTVGTVTIPHYRIFFIAISILLIFLVHMLLTRTRIGIVIRAGVTDRSAVEVLGIKVKNYFTLLFAIGSGLAGIAGVLMAPLGTLFPGMGGELIIWAFIIVIIGGLGSFKGAIIGGIIIGLLHSLGAIVLGPDVLLVTFVILIVILLFKPQGLFGVRKI
jgi:branched-subunit amino acid ABC-type transport system permease component